MSTGNLHTVGSINSRLKALNLANSASMYAIYEVQSNFDPSIGLWPPGPTPTPNTSLSFVYYDDSAIKPNLKGLPGKNESCLF